LILNKIIVLAMKVKLDWLFIRETQISKNVVN
jgi:hypothetical protein